MLRKIKTIMKIFGVGLILGAGVSIALYVCYKLFWIRQNDYITEGLAAFTGAAVVFIFTLIGQWLNQLRQRKLRHYNALVRSDYLLNTYLNIIEDNRRLIEGAVSSFSRRGFHVLNFKHFDIDHDCVLDFRNLALINERMELNVDLRRFNESCGTCLSLYTDVKEALQTGRLTVEQADSNFAYIAEGLNELQKALSQLDEKIKNTLCSCRILLREEKPLMHNLYHGRYAKNHQKKIQAERRRLNDEIPESIKKSLEEKKAFGFGKSKNPSPLNNEF